jgi:hypothetical protein
MALYEDGILTEEGFGLVLDAELEMPPEADMYVYLHEFFREQAQEFHDAVNDYIELCLGAVGQDSPMPRYLVDPNG